MDKAAWVFVIIALVFGALASGSFWFERVVVWALRTFHIFAFPNAIRIAVSLERDGAEWELGTSYLKHPKIGSIRMGSVHSVCVHLDGKQPSLIWEPNFIERRIIWDAVQAWMAHRIDAHLDRTLPA
jgi:hypothetical protein